MNDYLAMQMKLSVTRIFLRAVLTAFVASLCGCTIYSDEMYPEDPAADAFRSVYSETVDRFFRMTELCDFFSAYQEIKSDADAGLALAESYFGDNVYYLVYDRLSVTGWGVLGLSDDGSFLVGDSAVELWPVIPVGDRTYVSDIVTASGSHSFRSSVRDGKVVLEALSVEYVAADGVKVSLELISPVSRDMCSCGQAPLWPDAGALEVMFSGQGADDFFTVRFEDGARYMERQ